MRKAAKVHFEATAVPAEPIHPRTGQSRRDAQIQTAPVEIVTRSGRRGETCGQSSHSLVPQAVPQSDADHTERRRARKNE
jgi:hypothetical protein